MLKIKILNLRTTGSEGKHRQFSCVACTRVDSVHDCRQNDVINGQKCKDLAREPQDATAHVVLVDFMKPRLRERFNNKLSARRQRFCICWNNLTSIHFELTLYQLC